LDCDFCAEFASDRTGGRIILQEADWLLLPTLGCFAAGYCLLMPIGHIEAVAELSQAELIWTQDLLERMRDLVGRHFGPAIVAEHGPGRCDLGASCCSHAHLHLIPVGPDVGAVVAAYQRVGGPPRILRDLSELSTVAGEPYMYLSPTNRTHLLWEAAGFPRQFVRRVCADLLGLGDRYDWRDHTFPQNMKETLTSLRRPVGHEAKV
jgi:diadenosine tetraphosphate (Ap4A) HIT family hydrolase